MPGGQGIQILPMPGNGSASASSAMGPEQMAEMKMALSLREKMARDCALRREADGPSEEVSQIMDACEVQFSNRTDFENLKKQGIEAAKLGLPRLKCGQEVVEFL